MNAEEQIKGCSEFLEKNQAEIISTMRKGEKGLVLDFKKILLHNFELAEEILDNPTDIFAAFSMALKDRFPETEGINVRFKNLPASQRIMIKEIRNKHKNKMVSINARLLRKSEILTQISHSTFECPSCGQIISFIQLDEMFKEPSRCGCGRKGKFTLTNTKQIDIQSLVLQDKEEYLEGAEQPATIGALLKEDLVAPYKTKKLNPGSNIIINGVVKEMPIYIKGRRSVKSRLYIEANYVGFLGESFDDMIITEKEEKQIKEVAKKEPLNLMIQTLAPTIYGYEEVKEAILLQLFGGVEKILEDGRKVRGDTHILLAGDPGVSKTSLLRYVQQIAPKAVYASGKGSSGRGVSAAVIKDEFLRCWTIEAGAAVLANKGILAFDELDKMVNEDRSALHEIMESQSVTISKAGLHASLMAKTTILAAINPKHGRFDVYSEFVKQIELESTLINRFDLIFILRDILHEETDKKLSKHILKAHMKELALDKTLEKNKFSDKIFLKKYLSYAKKNCFPKMTKKAANAIDIYYNETRKKGYSEGGLFAIPINPRYLEGMIRLAEASARSRLSDKVEEKDAMRAIGIINYCLIELGFDPNTGTIDIDRIAGTPFSTRSAVNIIKEIITEIAESISGPFPFSNIMEKAKEKNVTEDKAEEAVEKLRREGFIYEPRPGFFERI